MFDCFCGLPVCLDELKELVKEFRQTMSQFKEVVSQFLREHPELVTYLKGATFGAAITIVVGTIAEDIAALGGGIADDGPRFYWPTK